MLGFTMLFTGISSLIFEYVFSTVFTYLLGDSIVQFSVTIGLMMGAMGVGTILQKYLPEHSLVGTFLGIELMLVVTGGFAPILLQWAYSVLPDDFGWVKFLYSVITGLAIGMEIPLVMRINERFTDKLGDNMAETWAWDYLGGAGGVVLWIFALRSGAPLTTISYWVAGCNFAVALVTLWFFWRQGMLGRLGRIVATTTVLIVTTGMLTGMTQTSNWSRAINQSLYEDPIAAIFTTQYQNIALTEGDYSMIPGDSNWTLWLNGNKQFSSLDEAIYHENLVHPAMSLAAQRKHVLVLGGGDGMALRELAKYPDVQDVTLVDLDPGMIEFASTNPAMRKLNQDAFKDARVTSNLEDPSLSAGVKSTGEKQQVLVETDEVGQSDCKEVEQNGRRVSECAEVPVTKPLEDVSVFTVDADKFVAGRPGIWDVVIIDLPDPNSIELAKLYSVEFYQKVRKVLSPDGVVVVQATSPYHAKETFLCIQRSMNAAGLNTMPYHANVPSFGDWGWVLASPSLSQPELYQRAEGLKSFDVPTREVDAAVFRSNLIFNRGWLDSQNTEVSTLMRPVVFDYYTYEGWVVE